MEAFWRAMTGLASRGWVGLGTVVFYLVKGAVIWAVVAVVLAVAPHVRADLMQNIIIP